MDFLSVPGGRSPIGVEGADPVGSTESARPASLRMALLLRFARLAARLSSWEASRLMIARKRSAFDFVPRSVEEWEPVTCQWTRK